MQHLHIAVIPGDGIGQEVVPVAVDLLRAVTDAGGQARLSFDEYPWGCDYYLAEGRMMPDDALDALRPADAIFLGAIGDPARVPDHVSLWGLLLRIRRSFSQVLNIRPARFLEGCRPPFATRAPSTWSSSARTRRASTRRSGASSARAPTRRPCR